MLFDDLSLIENRTELRTYAATPPPRPVHLGELVSISVHHVLCMRVYLGKCEKTSKRRVGEQRTEILSTSQ